MARIPDEVVNKIKKGVSLLTTVERQGRSAEKVGKDYAVHCPFHEDDMPSCMISPKGNVYHCFGCGAAGSVIDWVMKTDNLSFREAIEILSPHLSPLAVPSSPTTPALSPSSDASGSPEKDKQILLARVTDFYFTTLKESSEALEYLASRGLNDPELIDTFKLGYANRTLGKSLPEKNRKAGADMRSQLQDIGILRESGHEHFNGSLVIPVIDENGHITEIYGRKLLDNLRKGTPKHLYLPGPHAGIFNPPSLSCPDIILCESLIDALTFWRHGLRNVTTSYGTQGFTEELLSAFKQSNIKKVYIAYDNDDAGNVAADKLWEKLINEPIEVYRLVFPEGMDANAYAVQATEPDKALHEVMENAVYLGGRCKDAKPTPQAQPSTDENGLSDVLKLEEIDGEVHLEIGNRHYRLRGLDKAKQYQQLKINLCVSRGKDLYIDQLDLYHSKARQHFIKQAAIELGETEGVIKSDVNQVLLGMEQLQKKKIKETVSVEEDKHECALSESEKQLGLKLLRDPSLLSRLLDDFETCGVVGEERNMLVSYLAAVSRKLDKPLAVIVQSTSAAGKSSLMNAVLAMIPEDEKIQYSAMTGQSLFYMGETNLKHKILAIAEEEGAEQASYALKLLQSEGELTIASTGKDMDGNLTTQEYHVEGPVMLFSTTTAIDIDEELLNRCIVLTVNESQEQTELIHALQRDRETLAGMEADEDREDILKCHRAAQALLKPVRVINPYAPRLTFSSTQTRSRRDHPKYLRLIRSIALLHQYQREEKIHHYKGKSLPYIEVALGDIAIANQLAHEVLGRSLDELPPQTRKLLQQLHKMVKAECQSQKLSQGQYRFSRREVRNYTQWGDTQLKVHLARLVDMEYLMAHKKGQQFFYEMLYQGEGQDGSLFMMNLIDVETLGYDGEWSGLKARWSGCGRPVVGVQSGGGREDKNEENTTNKDSNAKKTKINGKRNVPGENALASYRNPIPPLAVQETQEHKSTERV